MDIANDIAQVIADFGSLCVVQAEGQEPMPECMILVRRMSSGKIETRRNVFPFFDLQTAPRGADWAYGLMLAEDAPANMHEKMRLTVVDSDGEKYRCDAASPMLSVDFETRKKTVVAWRMALRGVQGMVRG